MIRALPLLALILLAGPVAAEEAAPFAVHYAPAENLERVDVALLDRATQAIDMCAYVLTDYPVIEALMRAARRGVAVRILLDREESPRTRANARFATLAATPGVTIHVKRGRDLMHLKSYAVDGATLRSGAANFSASGLKRQDNDLLVIESRAAAAGFEANFETVFAAGDPL